MGTTDLPWSPVRRVLFRWLFVYCTLFCVDYLPAVLPGGERLLHLWSALWQRVTAGLSAHLFHLSVDTSYHGSGDRKLDWLICALRVVIAIVAAIIWSLLARRRSYPLLWRVLHTAIRYALAVVILGGYGIPKLLGGQFPALDQGWLASRFGVISPAGLLWRFMGFSLPYVVFSGVAETVGSRLLLFRRTATLGALILIAVLTNVVLLNFCYDVPVKLASTHFLLMAVLIAAPALPHMLASILAVPSPAVRQRAWLVVKLALLAWFIGDVSYQTYRSGQWRLLHPARDWRDGGWLVTEFERNGAIDESPQLWKRILLVGSDGVLYLRWVTVDKKGSKLHALLAPGQEASAQAEVEVPATAYTTTRKDDDHAELSGQFDNARIRAELERLPQPSPTPNPLLTRGFHWVQQAPFYR